MWIVVGSWLAWLVYWYVAAIWANATKSSETVLQRLRHTVPLGLAFFLMLHNQRRPVIYGDMLHGMGWKPIGLALVLTGIAFMIWARLHLGKYWSGVITLKEGHRLIRTGPYRLVRHPIYTGFLCAAIGTAMVAGTGDAMLGAGCALIAFLIKIAREEAVLKREFGDEYERFAREVPGLIPFCKLS
jgi:protein-S-isoprenylcysteine O-methyltransferase Ste14